MNNPVVLAQLSGSAPPSNSSPKHLKVEKPQNGQAVAVHLDGGTRIDFSDVASEKLTFVRVGDKLIVLFDNHSTVTIDPVFDSAGHPLPDVAFDMAPDRTLTGQEFASLFPITTDQSVLPAAGTGSNGPMAGAHFGDPSVDPLTVGTPLALLGPGSGPGSNFASLPTETPAPTHAPTATPDSTSVVEAGVNPANVPFAGTPITTGNVLTNDITVDPGAVKTVIGVAVGAGSTPTGSNIGATLTGSYGTLVLGADGSYTYTLDNTNTAGKALAQGQHASDVFTYTMSDSLGHSASTTLTIDVVGTNDQPVIASGAESSSLAELPNTTGSSTHDTTLPVPTGTLNFTDVNLADTHSLGVTLQSAVWSGGPNIPAATQADLLAAPQTALHDSTNAGSGSIDWSFNIADKDLDFLAQGETLKLTYGVKVTDSAGAASNTQTVTITVTGSNDLPIVTAAQATGDVTEGHPVQGPNLVTNGNFETGDFTGWSAGAHSSVDELFVRGLFTADLGPTPLNSEAHESLSQHIATTAGTTYQITFFAARGVEFDPASTFTVDWNGTPLATLDSGSPLGFTEYTYTVTATGPDTVLSFDYRDNADVWRLDDVSVTGTSVPVQQTATGTISFADADLNDTHSVPTVAFKSTTLDGGLGPGLGTLTAGMTHDPTGTGLGGVVSWQFAVNNNDPRVQALGAGEQITEVFTVKIADNHGGQTTQDVAITIHGINAAPTFVSGPATSQLTEDANVSLAGNLHSQGTLAFTDVNLSDTHTVSTSLTASYSGGPTIPIPDSVLQSALSTTLHDSTGGAPGSVDWSFALADDVADFLAQGEALTLTYNVKVTDSQLASTTQTVKVTIQGVNDSPVVNNTVATGQEDTPPIAVTLTGSDADHGDSIATFKLNNLPADGTLYLDSAMTVLAATGVDYAASGTNALTLYFKPNHDFSGSDTVQYTATDHFGAVSSAAIATIDVAPVADTPTLTTLETSTISGPATVGAYEVHGVALAGGGFVVSWVAGTSGNLGVHFQVYDAHNQPVGSGVAVDSALPSEPFSLLTALKNGNFAVTWLNGHTLTESVYDAAGSLVGSHTVATSADPMSEVQTITLADGDFAVLYQRNDGGSDPNVYIHVFHPDGTAASGEMSVNGALNGVSDFLGGSFGPLQINEINQIVPTEHGFAVMWSSFRDDGFGDAHSDVFVRAFNADGSPASPELQVNAQPSVAFSNTADNPGEIVTLTADSFAVVWEHDDNNTGVATIDYRVFSAADNYAGSTGGPINDTLGGATAAQGAPLHIAKLATGGFAILWDQIDAGANQHAFVQAFDANGHVLGPAGGIQVDQSGPSNVADQVLALAGGRFAVMWDSGGVGVGDVFVRVFAADGTPVTAAIQVDPPNPGISSGFQMTTLPDGSLDVAWVETDITANGHQQQLFLQHYTSDGTAAGTPVLLASSPAVDPANIHDFSQFSEFRDVLSGNGTLLNTTITNDSGTDAGHNPFSHNGLTLPFVYTAHGSENTPIALINAAVTDTSTSTTAGGLEALTLTISGFPVGTIFTANGAQVGTFDSVHNTWGVSDPSQITTLATIPLSIETPKGFSGSFTLSIDAQVVDSAVLSTGLAHSAPLDVIKTYDVTVTDSNDVTLSNPTKVATVAGLGAVSLGIAAPIDADGGNDVSIQLNALPLYGTVQYFNGANLVVAHAGDVLTSAELTSLQFLPPASGAFQGDSLVYSVFDGPNAVNGAVAIDVTAPQTGALYFSAVATGNSGPDLFTINGNDNFTPIPVRHDSSASFGSNAGEDGGYVSFAGKLYFFADSPTAPTGTGPALFSLDASGVSTPVVSGGQFIGGPDQFDAHFTVFDGSLYFIGLGTAGFDLFKVDPNGAVTELNINPSGDAFDQNLDNGLVQFDGKLYFAAYTDGSHSASQLFAIDQSGQLSHFDVSSAGEDGGFIAFGGGLFFNAFDPIHGDVLCKIDANGMPTPVRDVCGCPIDHLFQEASNFHLFNGSLYFNELGSTTLTSLYRLDADGTVTEIGNGTDFFDFTFANQQNLGGLTDFNGSLYFSAQAPGDFNPVLYQIDNHGAVSQVQGTGADALIFGGEDGGFVQFDGHLYFFAFDPALGSDTLFELDSSGHATAVVDPTSSGPFPYFGVPQHGDAHFTISGGNLYFDAGTAKGDELVRIDSGGAPHVVDVNTDLSGNSFPGSDGGFGAYRPTPTLVGTTGHDLLVGGPGNETFIGGQGNDTIIGGGGFDTARFSGNFAASTISFSSGHVVVSGPDGTDTLTGISRLQFADHGLLIVDPTGQYGFSSVQAAINAATAGDTIWVLPGTYTESTIPTGISGTAGGLFINTPNLTIQGVEADGTPITTAAQAKADGAVIISGSQTDFGSNHFIGPDGDNAVIQGLHLQAGAQTDNKLLEIWANNVTVENNFLDVNIGGTTPSGAAAIYFNDNGTRFTDEIAAYTVTHNILNEGVVLSNGVGIPSPAPSPNQIISDNIFQGTFDIATGLGRYDTIVLNGKVPGIGWLLESTQIPTIIGNQFGDNTTPFLLRGSDIHAANLPTLQEVQDFLTTNGNLDTTYAYVETSGGNLELAARNYGSGPFYSFAVTNSIDMLELALEHPGGNTVFPDQRTYLQSGDTVVLQSGPNALSSSIEVDNLKVMADADSAHLTLTLATQLPDAEPVTAQSLTLLDYAPGQGANVNVVGNDLGDTIQSDHGTHIITTGSGADTITGGGGADTINAGGGNDTIVYNVASGGREMVDGGPGADTQQINNDSGSAETFNINPIDATHLGINIEPGANNAVAATSGNSQISDTNVEEIVVHLGNAGDTVLVSGNLGGTGVLTSTITVDGGSGNDTVDASAIDPAYRVDVVFNGGGGNDVFKSGPGDDSFTDTGAGTAVYSETLAASNFSFSAGMWIVATSGEGTDTLSGVAMVDDGSSGHHFLPVGGGSQYATIQQAVDAAQAGDTILVAPGSYAGQVVVDPTQGHGADGISIVGIGSVILDAPASLISTGHSPTNGRDIDGIVTVSHASNVTVEGISVNGLQEGASVTGASNPTLVGIAYLNASGTVDHVDVTGIREGDASFGDQRGIGIYASNAAPGNAFTVTNSTVEDFQKGGIVVTNATVEISHDNVTGVGATSLIAQNGIQVVGVTGDVSHNAINDIGYVPAGTTDTGILFWNSSNLTIENNTITGALNHGAAVSQTGIYGLNSSAITIDGNTIANVLEGIGAFNDHSGFFSGNFAPDWSVGIGNAVTNDAQFALDFEATDTSTLVAASQNFTVTGTAGNDFFIGGAGNDSFTGGGGLDTAGYIETLAPSNFSYGSGHWTVTTATEGTDRLTGFSIVTDGNNSGHRFLLVGGGSQYTTIQDAVNAAANGDAILLAPGTYHENVTINGKALTLEGFGAANGVGGAILDGSITETGALGGALTIDGIAIDATGQQYGLSLTPTLAGPEKVTISNLSVTGANQTGLAVFGGGTNLTVDVQHSSFGGDGGHGTFGGTGDVLFYNYTGDAALAHVTVTGTTGTVPASADHGIQFAGVSSGSSPVTSAIGHVSFEDVSVTGTYEKTLVYLQGYDNFSNLSFNATHIGDPASATSWTGLYVEPASTTGAFTPSATTSTLDLSHVTFGGGSYGWQTAFNLPGADDLILGVPTANHIIGSSANDAIVSFNGADVLAGGDGNDVYFVNSGHPTIVEQPNAGTDEVRSTVSYTLPANVENLTLLDPAHGPSDTQTFDNMALGPITNGENGWEVLAGGRDQGIVDLGGTHGHVFKMSSDPAVADFAGPYSPALSAVAGEPDTGAAFNSQMIDFQFKAVSDTPDGSRLEVDFGNKDGTDRNNFLVLESFAGSNGIRIAVSEPDLNGNFSGDGTDPAPNDRRQLASGVDPTQWHDLQMRLTYHDGPNNDVIKVFLDGQFIGSTTTFENFHDALGGTHIGNATTYETDRVFFRPSANGAPQDGAGGALDQGFYFDDLTTSVYNSIDGTGNGLNNVITGNSGDNVIIGGAGNDVLTGGAGANTFKFGEEGAANLDTILDFSNAKGDTIDISALLGAAAGAADANVSHYVNFAKSGNDLVLQVDATGSSAFGGGSHDVATLAGYAVSNQHIVDVVFNSHEHQIAV